MFLGRWTMERFRPKGSARITTIERNFPYLEQTTSRAGMTEKEAKKRLKKIRRIAYWLDDAVPGSPISFGFDSLLGFLPIIGGYLGAPLSLYQVYLSTAFGIPLWLLLRMLINIFIGNPENGWRAVISQLDVCMSMIPIIGGFLDVFYKANLWNYEALEDYVSQQAQLRQTSGSSKDTYLPDHTRTISWTQLAVDVCDGFRALAYRRPTRQKEKTTQKAPIG